MRFLRIMGAVLLSVFVLSLTVNAGEKDLGIASVRRVTFSNPVRVGTNLLRPGEYEVRHTMEGQEHIMVFRRVQGKEQAEVKVKCNLVALTKKAPQNQTVFEMNAANERVLRELIFRGDTAKHVF